MKTYEETFEVLYEDYKKMHHAFDYDPSTANELMQMIVTKEDMTTEGRKLREELTIKENTVASIYEKDISEVIDGLFFRYYGELEAARKADNGNA
ncbi:hypothetical protein [Gordonibacter sp.]|uniref:hypothetical protein n=1 Tax=Gordonibacter sp. TaxID=1968902 RepID=UPI002FCB85B8